MLLEAIYVQKSRKDRSATSLIVAMQATKCVSSISIVATR